MEPEDAKRRRQVLPSLPCRASPPPGRNPHERVPYPSIVQCLSNTVDGEGRFALEGE